MNICALSEEVLFNIFFYLEAKDLARCCKVSQLFKRMAEDERLWKALFPGLVVPLGETIKSYAQKNCVLSRKNIKSHLIQILSEKARSAIEYRFVQHSSLKIKMSADFCNGIPPYRRPDKFEKTYYVLEKMPVGEVSTDAFSQGLQPKKKDGVEYTVEYSGYSEEVIHILKTIGVFNKICEQETATSKFNEVYYFISSAVAIAAMAFQAYLNEKR
ncbi:MAG: F-box protein [Verrucomicrobia bacterium]|nr:F-box protein [Verrucomicrobiota bacterium]